MQRCVLLLATAVAIASGVHAAPRKRPDKAATYRFDLTREGDKKPSVLSLKLPEKFWQHSDHPPMYAPGTAVRKGWGAGWFVAVDYYDSGCQYHLFLEIEELGKRKLKKAAEDHNATLEEVCRKAQITLKSKPSKVKRYRKFKLRKKNAPAYTVRYNVTPQAVSGAVDPATALLFEVNGYLVTLTGVRWGTKDYFKDIVAGLAITDTPVPAQAGPFKLLDLTDGVSKFITLDYPGEFKRIYRYGHGRADAVWERHDKSGTLLARLTLSNHVLDGRTPEAWLKDRVRSYKDHYDAVSDPKTVKVGERSGQLLTFVDNSKEQEPAVRHVRKVFVKLHRELWDLTMETIGEDQARVAADAKLLATLLASVEMWRSQVK